MQNILKKMDFIGVAAVYSFLCSFCSHPIDTVVGLFKGKLPSKDTYTPPEVSAVTKEEIAQGIDNECGFFKELAADAEDPEDELIKIISVDYEKCDIDEVMSIIHLERGLSRPETQREGVELYRELTNWTVNDCKHFYKVTKHITLDGF